jgi:cell shape-determining protein MreD
LLLLLLLCSLICKYVQVEYGPMELDLNLSSTLLLLLLLFCSHHLQVRAG